MNDAFLLSKRELVSLLFREWRKLAGAFLGLFGLALGGSYLLTPSYEATIRLLVKSGREFQVHSDTGQTVTPYVTSLEVVNSELAIITSRDLLETVINQLGLGKLYPDIEADPPSNMRPIDAAIKQFQNDLKVEAVTQSQIIEASYFNPSRDMAIGAMATLIRAYKEKHANLHSEKKSGFLEQETKNYATKLAETDRRLAELKRSESVFDIPAQKVQLIQNRSVIAQALADLQSKKADTRKRIAYLTQSAKMLSPLVEGAVDDGIAFDNARTKMIDLQLQLQSLRQRYSTEVKPVKDIEEQLASLRQFILHGAEATAASIDQQIEIRTAQIGEIDDKLSSIEETARELDALQREHDTLADLLRTYRKSFEEARIDEELDRQRMVSVSVVQQPDAPTKPAKPKRLLFAVLGVVLGVMGSAAIVAYQLLFRETLIAPESIERVLKLPVLATVPLRPA